MARKTETAAEDVAAEIEAGVDQALENALAIADTDDLLLFTVANFQRAATKTRRELRQRQSQRITELSCPKEAEAA